MTTRTIGTVYDIAPQPPDPDRTVYHDTGLITIGVEYRNVDPAVLAASYEHDPEQLAALLAASAPEGFTDQGFSIHVVETATGHEYLRFDLFDDEPHYHYIHRSDKIVNNVVPYDPAASGDMVTWMRACLTDRLGPMLEHAGAHHLAAQLDAARVQAIVDALALSL